MTGEAERRSSGRRVSLSRRWIWGVGIAVSLVLVALAMRPDPVDVDVDTAEAGWLRVTIEEDGLTRIRDRYLVSADVAGNLSRITAEPGDSVLAGERVGFIAPGSAPLLDARSRDAAEARLAATRAAMEQATTAVRRAETALALAQEEVDRQRTMLEIGTGTDFRMRQAELQYQTREEELRSTEFGVEVARHEVESARSMLRQMDAGAESLGVVNVTTPVAGTVLQVFRRSGGFVSPGTPLIEVGDPNTLEVVVDVLTADAVRIEPGCHVAITRWGGPDEMHGVVHRVEPAAFTAVSALGVEEQRVNVVVDFGRADQRPLPLGDGYHVDVAIVVREIETIHVASGSVFPLGEGWAVFVAAEGRAQLREVAIGERAANRVEILRGLEAGETTIVYPSDEIGDGTRLRVRQSSRSAGAVSSP